MRYLRPETGRRPYTARAGTERTDPVKIIASQLRKGNVVMIDDRLYVILSAQNFHPGKGTPVTQVDMRRISDGVKVSERWKTTDQVDRAMVDEREYDFLYQDGEGYHFMEPQTYEQITVSEEVVGDGKVWLTDGLRCYVQTHDGASIAMTLPQKVTAEIAETEPVVKGQTASSSYKPAMLTNGVRVMVPPHISAGIRIIVNTEDNSYVERAKD
jgi:elongation factor P